MDFSSNHYASCLAGQGFQQTLSAPPMVAAAALAPHACNHAFTPLLLVTPLLVLSLVHGIISDPGINLRVILSFNLLLNTEASWFFFHKFF